MARVQTVHHYNNVKIESSWKNSRLATLTLKEIYTETFFSPEELQMFFISSRPLSQSSQQPQTCPEIWFIRKTVCLCVHKYWSSRGQQWVERESEGLYTTQLLSHRQVKALHAELSGVKTLWVDEVKCVPWSWTVKAKALTQTVSG